MSISLHPLQPTVVTVAVLACLFALATASAASGQVRNGREVAHEVCSTCHDVGVNQMFPPMLNVHTPSFREIANRPDTTARGLRRFVSHTHWDEKIIPMSMPNMMLSSDETDAVVSYIMSLRRAPRRPS